MTSGWSALAPALAARYRTFTLETRGHGRTGNPAGRPSYAQMADEVHLRQGMAFFDSAMLERESPEFAAELARRHDAHHHPGYWRELVEQVRANVEAELDWSEDDLRRIPTPTLLIMGEADFALSLEQMLEMRRAIPESEMLVLNHAGRDGLDNHRVQATRADVVGPVMLEFLERYAGAAPEPEVYAGVADDG